MTELTTSAGWSAGAVSHWLQQEQRLDRELFAARPRLSGDIEADVCIVGAGYTGLWTAYELLRRDPGMKVVLLEAEFVGYGASGRNGGAVIAQLNGSREYWDARGGAGAGVRMERAIQATVDEVGAVMAREDLGAFVKGGVLIAARTPLEDKRLRGSVVDDHKHGFTEDDCRYLDADAAAERIKVDHLLGARFSPHSAAINPGRLVRRLAATVERAGAVIHEGTKVTSITPRSGSTAAAAHTPYGTVRAKYVVRATEAYTQSLSSHKRRLIPVRTSMIVTEPLSDALWNRLGWERRETLLALHPFLHLQHTEDRRITIGGADNRLPYYYGSRPNPDGNAIPAVAEHFRRLLVKLFPQLADTRIDRSWAGVFGVTHHWAPCVQFDKAAGTAWAGGYVGEGVAASNLAGRTLADLITGADTEITHLPWVGEPPRNWEPEPLRSIGAFGIWAVRAIGDAGETRTGKRSRLVPLANRLSGFSGHLG